MSRHAYNITNLIGVLLMGGGAGWIYPPAGLLVAGGLVIALNIATIWMLRKCG